MNVNQEQATPKAGQVNEIALSSVEPRVGALRQAQLIAGGFVLAGTFVSSLWVLAPIVGVGLLVAGATGICPMERFLARLPWNHA